MDEFEGLWKCTFAMPGFGLMKAVFELEVDVDSINGTICLNDRIEADLEEIQIKRREFSSTAVLNQTKFCFELEIASDNPDRIEGLAMRGSQRMKLRGYRWDPIAADTTGLKKEELMQYEKDLQQKTIAEVPTRAESEIAMLVENLLNQMTIEEKIGQMYQIPGMGPVTGPDADLDDSITMIKKGLVGSILSVMTPNYAYALQRIAVDHSRLKIPLMFMADVIHGLKTIFPVPLALASSWDMEAIQQAAHIAAVESGVSGIHLTFAPMVDIARDPRWGRIMEGAGEDPYLGSCCAQAWVKGFQGSNLNARDTIIGCVKHYAAYGGAEAGRDYNTVDMSDFQLRNYYLPPYKAAIDAKVGCLMSSFNALSGIPATGNKYILKEILREEWGYSGMTISDYNSVVEMIAHGVAADIKEAAKLALDATLDIEMVSTTYLSSLKELLQTKEIDITQIDTAVRRILTYKYRLGLFDDPYRYIDLEAAGKLLLCEDHRKSARLIAQKSMVLLKNDIHSPLKRPILPLEEEVLKNINKIALIGPFADEKAIIGGWAALGSNSDAISLKEGVEKKLAEIQKQTNKFIALSVVRGCGFLPEAKEGIENAIKAAEQADLVILAMGEPQGMSGEAKSRAFLDLPGGQLEMLKRIAELKKPAVGILFNGRPLILTEIHSLCNSLLEVWFPGTEGGNAVADVLFGEYNPSGKLPVSFPLSVGQIPIYYNHFRTGRPALDPDQPGGYNSHYLDSANSPLFPFGFGLSYTTFQYSNGKISSSQLKSGGAIQVEVTITNTGQYAGEEIVQLYIQDVVGSAIRPVKELKAFQKIRLDPGEAKTVIFKIEEPMLRFWNQRQEYRSEPGDFSAMIGPDSENLNEFYFRMG